MTSAGSVEVRPNVLSSGHCSRVGGQRQAHRNGHWVADAVPVAILPPRCRNSPRVAEVLPLLCLHG